MTGTDLVQVPFATSEFADNPEQRCPCVLLIDSSKSMEGGKINQVNGGLKQFRQSCFQDPMAAKRVELAIVRFGEDVEVVRDFMGVEDFDAPVLKADGTTPMGEAILTAIDMVKRRKSLYSANGIAYYRPWIFMITDGEPTDEWRTAAKAVADGEKHKNFLFFAVAVNPADKDQLQQISVREVMSLNKTRFSDLFRWLSNSLSGVANSQPGDAIPLENPKVPGGWASTE